MPGSKQHRLEQDVNTSLLWGGGGGHGDNNTGGRGALCLTGSAFSRDSFYGLSGQGADSAFIMFFLEEQQNLPESAFERSALKESCLVWGTFLLLCNTSELCLSLCFAEVRGVACREPLSLPLRAPTSCAVYEFGCLCL